MRERGREREVREVGRGRERVREREGELERGSERWRKRVGETASGNRWQEPCLSAKRGRKERKKSIRVRK